MKRILTMAFALLALAVPLAPAALASEAELADVVRPVDEVQAPYPQHSTTAQLAPRQTVIQPQSQPAPLRLEAR
jgi:hypothetical protein